MDNTTLPELWQDRRTLKMLIEQLERRFVTYDLEADRARRQYHALPWFAFLRRPYFRALCQSYEHVAVSTRYLIEEAERRFSLHDREGAGEGEGEEPP